VGEVGFLTASIKTVADVRSATLSRGRAASRRSLPGFQEVKPVFAGLYPIDAAQYEDLRDAMDKLRLNDARFFTNRSSTALGFGFRCGFLGAAYGDRAGTLEREFNLELITTRPECAIA